MVYVTFQLYMREKEKKKTREERKKEGRKEQRKRGGESFAFYFS